MREGQKRVNVYIPDDLYSRVLNSEYNITEAIITGLTKLLEPTREDFDSEIGTLAKEDSNTLNTELVKLQEMTEEYKAQVQTLNAEITRLKTVIMEAPDPVDLVRLQERNDGLNLVIEEKNRSIERLEKEVNRLDLFSHYFKSNPVKQIEAPATERKKRWYEFWK